MSFIRKCVVMTIAITMAMNVEIADGWSLESTRSTISNENRRRAFLTTSTATIATITSAAPNSVSAKSLGSKDSVVQREINTFNSLIYNFKNTALDGGLDAKTLNEPSISFVEFGEAMKKGEVTFVEFMAPNGLVAYATLKKNAKKPIRIGQGYPTGARNSWSSPDFVIRSVSNYGVPYKFTVPALEKYKRKA